MHPSGAVREIAVLRTLALGDLLCAVPFLRALRHRFPDARISLIALPWARAFVERFDAYVDTLVPFPGWPGIPEVPYDSGRTLDFLRAAQARPVDLAIQAHGSGVDINAFVALLGAGRSAGYVLPGRVAPDGTWIEYPGRLPEVRRHLRLAAALDCAPGDVADARLEWPVREADLVALDDALSGVPTGLRPQNAGYAVVHPGASDPVRRWPPSRFAAVADHLVHSGLPVVLTGSATETTVTARVRAAMTTRALDLAGRTSLGALGALLAGARLVVTNDTGVGHLADAVGTPSVRIFRASEPARWAALDRSRHVALVPPDLDRRCALAGSPGHPDCLAARCLEGGADPAPSRSIVAFAAAVDAVDRLLGARIDRVA
jgi:ADP-heptose:LPS heptosyltransferase